MQRPMLRFALVLSLLSAVALAQASQDHSADNESGVPFPDAPGFTTADVAAHGREVAEFVERFDSGWVDEILQGDMTLFDAGGDSVRRAFARLVLEAPVDGDKVITKFLSPAEIKGVAALTHENPGSSDDNWLYLPANKRVRRISGANNTASFQGTEFTYEDLASLDAREYEWRFVRETTIERDGESLPVLQLDAVPTYEDTGYSRLSVYVHASEWRHERVEYFDKAGKHLKTREAGDWRLLHGRFWRSHHLQMVNHQTGKRTLLETKKYFVNLSLYTSSKTGKKRENLTEDMFTTRALES